jgi:hypothetical protein
VADREESREAPALRFVRVHWEGFEMAATGMRDMIHAAAKRSLIPRIDDIEYERPRGAWT